MRQALVGSPFQDRGRRTCPKQAIPCWVSPIWAVDIDQRLGSGVIVDDGKLYVVTRDGRLVCVQTGDLRADGWPMWGGTPSHAVEAE